MRVVIASKDGVTFREMLASGRFYYGAEVVTSRGIATPQAAPELTALARALLADPRIGWISITDNPGGGPMLPPDWLAGQLSGRGSQVVVHLTCKDANRNGLEAAAWRYASEGFPNILAITGDYPTGGFGGPAAGVFDLDSVGLIALLRSMNDGLVVPGRRGNLETLPKTDFFIGCVVSPFKRYERELMPQYFKLVRKLAAGARWVIPQLGYDMRKFHEVKLMLASRGIQAPIVGNVYLLSKGVARLFNSGKLAGCVVTRRVAQRVRKICRRSGQGEEVLPGAGRQAIGRVQRAGTSPPATWAASPRRRPSARSSIWPRAIGPDDWRDFIREIQYSQPDEFFLFEHDRMTGLSEPTRINPEYRRSLSQPPPSKEVTLNYRISRWVHGMAFTRDRGLFGLLRRLFGRWDKKPGVLGRMAYGVERQSKRLLYGCQECGDCNLPDCAYLCPRHACSKSGVNGPCGGSAKGRCELDDKECFWARVYERLKAYGESEHMLDRPVVIYDPRLKNTSSWANFYLDRDHSARQRSRPRPTRKKT